MQIAIGNFIGVGASSNNIAVLISDFEDRVVADSGTFESGECLATQINEMGSVFDLFQIVLTPNGYKAGKLYALKPTNGDFDIAFTRGSSAIRRTSAGAFTSETTNVPRIHTKIGYTCPVNLVEITRTNLLLRSEEADNASWTKTNATITANAATPPWTSATADAIFETVTVGQHRIEQAVSKAGSPIQYSLSCFVKPNGRDWIYLSLRNGANIINQWFNITTGVRGLTVDSGNYSWGFATMRAFEDGWYRVELNAITNTTTSVTSIVGCSTGDGASSDYAGDVTKGIYVWGMQLETTTIGMSNYIPTTTAAATRNTDTYTNKTGLSSYIGASGTLYFKGFLNLDSTDRRLFLTDGTDGKRIGLIFTTGNQVRLYIENSTSQADFTAQDVFRTESEMRIALVYTTNRAALFINGVKIGEDTSVSVPTGLDRITFDNASTVLKTACRVLAYSSTALTDDQAISLTTSSSYPPVIRNIIPATFTGNPDYYGFGNGVNLNSFFPDYSIYLAKRGPSHYLDGGNGFGMLYNAKYNLWSAVFETIDDGTTYYSGHSAGLVDNQIFVQVARYTVSGGVDTFQDIGYFTSVDLTTLTSAEDLRLSSSWNAFQTLPAPTETRYEAYGKILPSTQTPGKYFGPWFEHDGTNHRLNIRKIVVNGIDDFTITNVNVWANTNQYYEPSLVHCGGQNWLLFVRQGNATEMIHLFSSTDDCETWTDVGDTNLGSSSGDCVVDTFFYNNLVHVVYADRGNGCIMRSLNNTYANCLALTLNTATSYDNIGFGDSLGGLGYPSVWEIRDGVFIWTWCRETSTTEAHVYFTQDTI